MKKIFVLLLSFLCIFCVASAGCVDVVNSVVGSPNVGVSITDYMDGFDFSRGAYYTVQYQVYNSGNAPANNVVLHASLERGNGYIEDVQDVYIGQLKPGQSVYRTVNLDGSMGYSYTFKGSASYN